MLKLLSSTPPGQPPAPEAARLGRRLMIGGITLLILVTIIFVLMIWQPGGAEHAE